MMPAIGIDEKISKILSALLMYRDPDAEDIKCAIDSILHLIEEDRAARECCKAEREACAEIAEAWVDDRSEDRAQDPRPL